MPALLSDRLARHPHRDRRAPRRMRRPSLPALRPGPLAVERVTLPGGPLPATVRVAAAADFHARLDTPFIWGPALRELRNQADLLVIAGDLTDNGRIEEFQQVAEVLAQSGVPVIAVPGNHDRRCLRRAAMRRTLREAGVLLLDGTGVTVELTRPADGSNESDTVPVRLGLVGVGGYGGGFWPDEPGGGPPIHRVTQAVALRARREAARLDEALAAADDPVDARLVVMHYAPTATTLGNEPTVKYWMLGNVGLAHVVDRHAVELVLHGHAHLGNPAGETVGGTPVRNVAAHVVGAPVVYELAGRDDAWRPGATVRVGGLTRRGATGE